MSIRLVGTRTAAHAIRELLSRVAPRPHTPAERVERRQIPYWQESGWQQQGNLYTGQYHTPHRTFAGRVEQQGSRYFAFYLWQPPAAMRHHSHWACFVPKSGGWYQVHMARMPADVSSGILVIERILTEALEGE